MTADKKTLQQQTTLDNKHEQFLAEFAKDENEIIPSFQKRLLFLKTELKTFHMQKQVEKYLDNLDQQKKIAKKIQMLKEKKKKYFLDNAKYIFEYLENKKNIAVVELSETEENEKEKEEEKEEEKEMEMEKEEKENSLNKKATAPLLTKQHIVEEYFKAKNTSKTKPKVQKNLLSDFPFSFPSIASGNVPTMLVPTCRTKQIIASAATNDASSKNYNIVQKYLHNINTNYVDMDACIYSADVCNHCFQGELIVSEVEGNLICNKCFYCIPFLFETERPSYKDPPKEVCFYSYKRINHFKEIIAQVQGKVTTQIVPEVFREIRMQAKKERIVLAEITYSETREILRKLGYYKYYEHIPFILSKFGIPPPLFPVELQETLFNLFIEIQHPYSKHCPPDRLNFLNYYYTAYKLCELLGEDKFLPCFPMLKDADKRNEQDAIWKKICEELEWEFIPTI